MELDVLLPPKRLALAYAKGSGRMALALLLTHDVKLGQIIKNGKEPLIGQMRLQWWRDVIAKPAAQRPLGEPLLQNLGEFDSEKTQMLLAAAMQKNVDAWDMLLANADWTEDILTAHAKARSNVIFSTFANVARIEVPDFELEKAGQYWALSELAVQCQAKEQYEAVMPLLADNGPVYRFSRGLRPLSLLYFAARQPGSGKASGLRLIMHALTGW